MLVGEAQLKGDVADTLLLVLQQLFCSDEAYLQLILCRRDACLFLESPAEAGVTYAQFGGNILG